MQVEVTAVLPQGTVSIASGTDDRGRTVTFAGDWRPMRDIANAIADGKRPVVDVPEWAVLSVCPPKKES